MHMLCVLAYLMRSQASSRSFRLKVSQCTQTSRRARPADHAKRPQSSNFKFERQTDMKSEGHEHGKRDANYLRAGLEYCVAHLGNDAMLAVVRSFL